MKCQGELVQIYNDIAQDKLDCKYYEDSLGEKEIAMANRVEEGSASCGWVCL